MDSATCKPPPMLKKISKVGLEILPKTAGWIKCRVPDEQPYYYNTKLEEISLWEKPIVMKDVKIVSCRKPRRVDRTKKLIRKRKRSKPKRQSLRQSLLRKRHELRIKQEQFKTISEAPNGPSCSTYQSTFANGDLASQNSDFPLKWVSLGFFEYSNGCIL